MKNDNNEKPGNPFYVNGIPATGNTLYIIGHDELIEFAKTCANLNRPPEQKSIAKEVIEYPISQSEAIKIFGKSRQTFNNWRKKGLIKGIKIAGSIYFLPSELKDILNK